LTWVQFNDHIPGVLDAYNRGLVAWPGTGSASSQLDEKEQIIEHGLQCWQQGYQLQDLTREWDTFTSVIWRFARRMIRESECPRQ
jgi:hypothetical protein